MTHFYSKILLFGEYAIIKGSRGIAIPFQNYSGRFEFANSKDSVPANLALDQFSAYLQNSGILSHVLDIDQFQEDINKGLYFRSNIPCGHGLGSSGALCAAIFCRYAYNFELKNDYSSKELKYIQDHLALLESFYHGTSSGLDCLISLINKPILISGRNELKIIDRPNFEHFGFFYLLDSNISRKTAPLVHYFLDQLDRNDDFKNSVSKFIIDTNSIIDTVNTSNRSEFSRLFEEISQMQLKTFSHMVPDELKQLWRAGLESKEYFFKLCGAGGGGFFLIYSNQDITNRFDNLININ